VAGLNGDELSFNRIDSKNPDEIWSFDLKDVFEAYSELKILGQRILRSMFQ